MTLAVAALSIAAIFMTSSAGLLSRFYDKEREYRLAAESALELTRARLTYDSTIAIPDTGMIQLASGLTVPEASGATSSVVSVNVYAAVTGDTTGYFLPHVSLIATAYDAFGTRHVRRMDLQRESFSRYTLFTDSFPSGSSNTFGPGTVAGRVHSNGDWRSGSSAATAGIYKDSVTARGTFSGTATFETGSFGGVPRVPYPRDSTYAWMTALASAGNLSLAPVSGTGVGWRQGTRLEFVAFDTDGDTTITENEGFVRVFDLAADADTSRLKVSLEPSDWYILYYAKDWKEPIVQNQCGAFYYRGGKWQFFPVAVHRTAWARPIIQQQGNPNYPSVNPSDMSGMDGYTYAEVAAILAQPTARCFPSGSPYLANTERFTNTSGVVTGTDADSIPFGVLGGYGGTDTTFTPRARTCTINTTTVVGGNDGRCASGTIATLGSWRAFGGTAVTGIATTIRQGNELPYLWPLGGARNPTSRGVMRVTGGPLFVSGTLRGRLTLVVDGSVHIIEAVRQVNSPSDPSSVACTDQLGIVAQSDILVTDGALTRARRIATLFASFWRHLGPSRDVSIHATMMSLTGTVGLQEPSSASGSAVACPQDGSANSAGGCYRLTGGAIMRRYTPLFDGSNTGMRWDGTADRCQNTNRRPPFFPLTNRYTRVRTLEIEPSDANNPTKIRALLMRLKGKTL
jgi:hypothetical protein